MIIEIVTESAVAAVISHTLARDAVSQAFCAVAMGESLLFPTLAGSGGAPGARVNVKFSSDASAKLVGLKAGTFWPANRQAGLPNHSATTLLLDENTGFPRALINAGLLNRYRTAAANAVATDALAKVDATALAIIGAGGQAEHEVRALMEVRPIRTLRIGARSPENAAALKQRLQDLDADIQVCSIADAVQQADIVITATNASAPIVSTNDLKPGVHCSAMGADARGKQEFETDIGRRARLFADAPSQSCDIGELQHAFSEGLIKPIDITAIGEVLLGRAAGRLNRDDITFFDSSGLAAQDIYIAEAVLVEARRSGLTRTIEF